MAGFVFAEVSELTEMFRPLTGREEAWADLLLQAAAVWIKEQRPGIADDSLPAKVVSLDVVRTALETGKYTGHVSYSRTVGATAKSGTLAAAAGSLTWTDWHKEQLGISVRATPVGYFGDGPA